MVLNDNELPLQNKRSSFAEVVGLTELKLGCVLTPDACERGPCQHGGSCAGLASGGERLGSRHWGRLGWGDRGGWGEADLSQTALSSITNPSALPEVDSAHPCWLSLLTP